MRKNPPKVRRFAAQEGFQTKFLSSKADITIGGGAAGAGKTYASLLDMLRHIGDEHYRATLFRASHDEITMSGGIADESQDIYPHFGGEYNKSKRRWTFKSGAQIEFNIIGENKHHTKYQGSQFTVIHWEELTHFGIDEFMYMLSRNRSKAKVRPKIMATCNPDPDHWLFNFLQWWIDQETFYPIPERAGKLRYMYQESNEVIWGDTPEEVLAQRPGIIEAQAEKFGVSANDMIKSVTFIPGNIAENKALLANNPNYLASLNSLGENEKASLLDGRWRKIEDNMSVFSRAGLSAMRSNLAEDERRFITVDAAGLGADSEVYMVWYGWHLVEMKIESKTEALETYRNIEELRIKHRVRSTSHVVIDSDGVGHRAQKLGKYTAFHGGHNPVNIRKPYTKEQVLVNGQKLEAYENLKTQMAFHIAERIEGGGVQVSLNEGTVIIDGRRTDKRKKWGTNRATQQLIVELRSFKKVDKKRPQEKTKLEDKEVQKARLGHSPDMGDAFIMREFCEHIRQPRGMKVK